MPHPSEIPIMSLEKLKSLGMDQAEYGTCSRTIKEGRTVISAGCSSYPTCPWAQEPVPDRLVKDPKTGVETKIEGGQRPRNLKYQMVKPTVNGRRRIKEAYCSCFEWHQNFAKLHRNNGVNIRVVGGEGSSYQARGSVRVESKEAGVEPHWEPKFWKEVVPPFDPGQLVDVTGEAYADAIIRESEALEESADLRRSMGIKPSEGARDITLELDEHEVAQVVKARGPKDH